MSRGKAVLAVVLVLGCLWLGFGSASAASAEDANRTLIIKGGQVTTEDTVAAFWECPKLTAGQARRNGTLTITNQSGVAMAVKPGEVELPYDNEEAIAYLNALHLTIRDGDTVLYDGAYVCINEDGLSAPISVKNGESRVLTIGVSCDFAYTGTADCGQVIYWNWGAVVSWSAMGQTVLDCWMIWVPALGLLILLIVVLKGCKKKKKKKEKPVSAAKPAVPPKAEKPRSGGAKHAAPRHAKKK